jgi:hypothetical protein
MSSNALLSATSSLWRVRKDLRLRHGVLASGKIRTDAEEARRRESGEKGRMVFSGWERTDEERKMSLVLQLPQKLSLRASPLVCTYFSHYLHKRLLMCDGIVTIAYHLLRMPFVFPIIGCRKVEHLRENLQALDITQTPERTQKIENETEFDVGFPFKTFVSRVLPLPLELEYTNSWIPRELA